MQIIVATKNEGKIREIKALLPQYSVITMAEAGITENLPETGATFRENALQKAKGLMKHGLPMVVADDSGLVVDALDGAPGIFSARYAGESATDADNNKKLLNELGGQKNRAAKFCCVIC